MPWCKGCKSHHVAPMLWRYGTVKAGARLDSERRYVLGKPGRAPAAPEAVKRFLHFYGPATARDFTEWAGVAKPHAERLWTAIEGGLSEVTMGKRKGWLLRKDAGDLDSPPQAQGTCLIPPGDPYLQKPNRPLLAPEARPAQAAVPACCKPRRGAQGRQARRPLAASRSRGRRLRSPSRSSGGSLARTSRRRLSAWPTCVASQRSCSPPWTESAPSCPVPRCTP